MSIQKQDKEPDEDLQANISDFITQFYLIVLGIAVGFAVETFLNSPTLAGALRFVTILLMLITWLHAQLGFATSEQGYEVKVNWFGRLILFYSELVSPVFMVFAALTQNQEIPFYIMVVASFGFDLLNQTIYLFQLPSTQIDLAREREMTISWASTGLFALLSVSIVIYLRTSAGLGELTASTIVLASILAITLWDYSTNQDFYFGLPRSQNSTTTQIKSLWSRPRRRIRKRHYPEP